MILFSKISYPTESVKEIAERFLEAPQVPDFMKKQGPFVHASLEEGITTFSIYELDRSKLADGYEFLGNYMATFFGVPGFRYEFKASFEIQEALKMIGM